MGMSWHDAPSRNLERLHRRHTPNMHGHAGLMESLGFKSTMSLKKRRSRSNADFSATLQVNHI